MWSTCSGAIEASARAPCTALLACCGVGARDDGVMGVAARAASRDLRVGRAAAPPGGRGALQHADDAPLAEHEAVAAAIERPRGSGRVVVAPRECPEIAERRQADGRDRHLAAARDAEVGQSQAEPHPPDLECEVARRTRGREAHGRAREPEPAPHAVERRLAVLSGIGEPAAATKRVRFPELHPFGPDPQHQPDAPVVAGRPSNLRL